MDDLEWEWDDVPKGARVIVDGPEAKSVIRVSRAANAVDGARRFSRRGSDTESSTSTLIGSNLGPVTWAWKPVSRMATSHSARAFSSVAELSRTTLPLSSLMNGSKRSRSPKCSVV